MLIQTLGHCGVVFWIHTQRLAPRVAQRLAISNDKLTVLEKIRSVSEHRRPICLHFVDRDVRDRARRKLAPILEPIKFPGGGPTATGLRTRRSFERRETFVSFAPPYAAARSAAVQRNSVPSTHMRCMMTPILRASATFARFMTRSSRREANWH
jgi:hypothetical protein